MKHLAQPYRRLVLGKKGRRKTSATLDLASRAALQESEARYQKLAIHLEDEINKRTDELSKALAAARMADQTKDIFLANISHELRTPLNVVIGFADLALRSNQDPRQGNYLGKIGAAGKLLSGIINDILDLSNIAAGRMELKANTFSLRSLMHQITSAMAHRAAEHELSLNSHIHDNVPDVLFGDSRRLEQIVRNLLGNAIKFTQIGHVEVRVALHAGNDSRICLGIEVEDSGIGMSESEMGQLFKPFSQADTSIARQYGGAGLGLAICQRLVELMDGSISVNSREGLGTTFRVSVWFGLGHVAHLPEPAAHSSAANQALPASYRNAHVLVVEDQPLNREIVKNLLAVVGITAQMATNGQEGNNILAARGPDYFDLVLMDVQMPVLDGLSATREIRTWAGFHELPIISMTAQITEHEKQISTTAGMNDHICKPFETLCFYRLLAKWIPQFKQHDPAASDLMAEPCLAHELPVLSGIDTQGGLSRFVGNAQRYQHWLAMFAEEAPGNVTQIRQALVSGDREQARKSSHSMKGRAGMLGLTELHRIAAELETAVGSNRPSADLLVSMEQEIQRVCKELKGAFAPGAQTSSADSGLIGKPSSIDPVERRQQARRNKLILLIDDDPAVLETLDECLQQGFQTRLAACGIDGIEQAQLQPQPDLILLDIELPDIQGYDICATLKANPVTASIPVIFLSSHTGVMDITRGLDVGAVDYVAKPVAIPILLARVQTHLRLRETSDILRNQNMQLETLVGNRTRDLEARTAELQQNQYLTIVAMGSIAETRDNETGNHIFRTSAYVELLAKRLATKPRYRDIFKEDEWEMIWKSAPLHDIGKVGIPDDILLKPGQLTVEEFEVMKRHTVLGRDSLRMAETRSRTEGSFLRTAAEIAYSHHERWDGTGYPEGISGEAIPLSARMMAVADVYDALISKRVYKAAISHAAAVEIIHEASGSQFDPEIVACFLEEADEFHYIASTFRDTHIKEHPACLA